MAEGGFTVDKRRWIALLISFNFAIIFVLGGFVYQKYLEIERLYTEQEDAGALALNRLSENVAEMDLVLRLGQHATSPEVFAALGARLYSRAASAGLALEKLPVELEETAAFFGRVEDYARALARTAYTRTGHTAEELARLRLLSETAALVGTATDLASLREMEAELAGFVAVFNPVAANTDTQAVTVGAARAAVAAFTGLKESVFRYVGNHSFRARVDGGEFTARVCKETGRVIWAENSRQVRRAVLTAEVVLEQAQVFLVRNGYEDMALHRWQKEAQQITAHFVPLRDGVFLYPDAIQISLGLDNGRITAFSAESQAVRTLPEPVVTKEQALQAVSDSLTVKTTDMALISTAGGDELLCFRFQTYGADGQAYLVYVSAETGRQQEIRLLVESDAGVLVL